MRKWYVANYYELFPVSVTTLIFKHCAQYLMYDNQVEVREYCLRVRYTIQTMQSTLRKKKKEMILPIIAIIVISTVSTIILSYSYR